MKKIKKYNDKKNIADLGNNVITKGKYKGKKISEIVNLDSAYVNWYREREQKLANSSEFKKLIIYANDVRDACRTPVNNNKDNIHDIHSSDYGHYRMHTITENKENEEEKKNYSDGDVDQNTTNDFEITLIDSRRNDYYNMQKSRYNAKINQQMKNPDVLRNMINNITDSIKNNNSNITDNSLIQIIVTDPEL